MSGFPGPPVPPEVIAALAKDNQSPLVISIVAASTGLGFFCVLLRFFSRLKYVGFVGLEDYLIVLSMIFSALTSVCLIQGAVLGNGKHFLNVPPQNFLQLLRYLYFGILAYHVSLTFTKLSILTQYWRIFTFRGSRMPIYLAAGLCTAYGITATVSATFTCTPIDAYWDYSKKPFAKCVNQDKMYHANAGINIATDLIVAALPLQPMWNLRIPIRQKIAVIAILTLGWFVVIISILRLYFLVLVAEHPMDATWYSGPVAYWSALEINLAIVCASTPALKPLIVNILPKFGTRVQPSDNSASAHSGSKDIKNNGHFLKLKNMSQHSGEQESLDQVLLQNGGHNGGRPLQSSHGRREQDWKEIRVTRSVEQRSMDKDLSYP
ncbi:hypothetical protein M011DRAFT_474224 [Sporormia fimetaria CBS 119925]|uniref:Rhodopsin domain-containing protein n=1 Tax=Sporormia fimetaria CBS 119925 TaxID=1340428 RepID=A0A6A6VNJ0_9PLEO|nr:hypothetical protein M011DRAFT_474224 [Sporormia fimetaria CBS 119925]